MHIILREKAKGIGRTFYIYYKSPVPPKQMGIINSQTLKCKLMIIRHFGQTSVADK